jgi:hypothetical protein
MIVYIVKRLSCKEDKETQVLLVAFVPLVSNSTNMIGMHNVKIQAHTYAYIYLLCIPLEEGVTQQLKESLLWEMVKVPLVDNLATLDILD